MKAAWYDVIEVAFAANVEVDLALLKTGGNAIAEAHEQVERGQPNGKVIVVQRLSR